jgi:hypothetical protein
LYQQLEKRVFTRRGALQAASNQTPSAAWITPSAAWITVKWLCFAFTFRMNRSAKSRRTKLRTQRLLLVCAVVFAVLLLLLRLLRFIHGRY